MEITSNRKTSNEELRTNNYELNVKCNFKYIWANSNKLIEANFDKETCQEMNIRLLFRSGEVMGDQV